MGDYCECIVPSDRRWDTNAIAPWVERSNIAESQRKWIYHLFKPIASKCFGLLTGNHEEAIRLNNYQDIHLDLCRDLGVKALGYSCLVRVVFARLRTKDLRRIDMHFEHGSGGAQTAGGLSQRIVKMLESYTDDIRICAMGHLHQIKHEGPTKIGINAVMDVIDQPRFGAITGSWFKGYQQGEAISYVEKAGYKPTRLGCPVFLIRPNKNQIGVVDFIEPWER